MTLLQRSDGDDYSSGVSYLDLAELIIQSGHQVERDLEELWRRIVFFICISNTDDHLRNHGFLLTRQGWRLAPAYDVNPTPHGNGLHLNISETDNSQDLDLALKVAPYFRVKHTQALEIVKDSVSVVANWRTVAKSLGIGRDEQERMASAFDHAHYGTTVSK
jgi:serine/threonine-protein kinase HipA